VLSGNPVRVPLHDAGEHQLVHVFSASVHVPYVTANFRTPAKVEQVVTTQSNVYYDGTYTVPTDVDIVGLSLTPSKIGLVRETQRKYELRHFGYVSQWESF
jgi:hypothetical protein